MIAGTVKPRLFCVPVLQSVVAEIAGERFCPIEVHYAGKTGREPGVFCEERQNREEASKKLLEQ